MTNDELLEIFDIVEEKNGIPVLRNAEDIATAYDAQSQDILFAVEDDSWWFNYRAEIISEAVFLYGNKEDLMIDVGGGNGFTTNELRKRGYNIALLEPSFEACLNCIRRGTVSICGSLDKECEKNNSIPQILLLDVLEHIEDDVEFLHDIQTKMKQGGLLLITVPASMKLWSSYDVTAGHYRRYTIDELVRKAIKAGFQVEYCSYFFGFLYPVIKMFRVWLEKVGIRKPKTERTEENNVIRNRQHKTNSPFIKKILLLMNKSEIRYINRKKTRRYGSSIICILYK